MWRDTHELSPTPGSSFISSRVDFLSANPNVTSNHASLWIQNRVQSVEPFITQLYITMHNMNHNLKCWSQWCLQMGWCDYLLLLNNFNETTSPLVIPVPESCDYHQQDTSYDTLFVSFQICSSMLLASCLCHVKMLQATCVTCA